MPVAHTAGFEMVYDAELAQQNGVVIHPIFYWRFMTSVVDRVTMSSRARLWFIGPATR
jgi:hypothetical protein